MAVGNTGALTGVRILDLTRVLAGAYTGMLLADMGADVIKIEAPGRGDDSRAFGPHIGGESLYYMNVNRNKRGVTLNLKGEGRQMFLEMVKQADVVLENYRPGVMKKLGLDYDELQRVNPKIIYAAVSGFGQTGPYVDRAGYDLIAQAMSGLMSLTGEEGGGPLRAGAPLIDMMAGLSAAIGILGALRHRDNSGHGQMLDVSLLDTAIAGLSTLHTFVTAGERVPTRTGNRYEPNYPNDSFRTSDGSVVVTAANDKLWRQVCAVMGRPELAERADFLANVDRVKNHRKVKEEMELWTTRHTSREVAEAMLAAGVPSAAISDLKQVYEGEQAQAHKLFATVNHPKAGPTRIFNTHINLSESALAIRAPAPTLGQHNEEVYDELLGLTAAHVAALRANNTI